MVFQRTRSHLKYRAIKRSLDVEKNNGDSKKMSIDLGVDLDGEFLIVCKEMLLES